MSQAKVEQYKKDKANRKKIMAQEKAKRTAEKVCAWVILLALVGWAGYAGVDYYQSKLPVKSVYTNLSALTDYVNGLTPAEE